MNFIIIAGVLAAVSLFITHFCLDENATTDEAAQRRRKNWKRTNTLVLVVIIVVSGYEKFEAESTQKELAKIEIQREVQQEVRDLGFEALEILFKFQNYRYHVRSYIELSELEGDAALIQRENGWLTEMKYSDPLQKAGQILLELKRVARDLSALKMSNQEEVSTQVSEWTSLTLSMDLEDLYRHTGSDLEKPNNYVEQTAKIVGRALWQDLEAGQRRSDILN